MLGASRRSGCELRSSEHCFLNKLLESGVLECFQAACGMSCFLSLFPQISDPLWSHASVKLVVTPVFISAAFLKSVEVLGDVHGADQYVSSLCYIYCHRLESSFQRLHSLLLVRVPWVSPSGGFVSKVEVWSPSCPFCLSTSRSCQ